MSEGSIMPSYSFMLRENLDTSTTAAKIRAMQTLGVPYEKGFDKIANTVLMKQAIGIADNLRADSILISTK